MRPQSFELYGVDWMIDQDLRLWLLEVNTSPGIVFTQSGGLEARMQSVYSDLFRLSLDKWFIPNQEGPLPNQEVLNPNNGMKLVLALDRATYPLKVKTQDKKTNPNPNPNPF